MRFFSFVFAMVALVSGAQAKQELTMTQKIASKAVNSFLQAKKSEPKNKSNRRQLKKKEDDTMSTVAYVGGGLFLAIALMIAHSAYRTASPVVDEEEAKAAEKAAANRAARDAAGEEAYQDMKEEQAAKEAAEEE